MEEKKTQKTFSLSNVSEGDKTYKQKAHIGQRVYFIENKIDENGQMKRDNYEIRDGIVTEVNIKVDYNLRSHKTFDGKNWTGPADTVVFNPGSFTTREVYQVMNTYHVLDARQIYTDLEELREAARHMVENNPGVTVEECIENYTVAYR